MTNQEQNAAIAEFCGHYVSEWFCNRCQLWIPAEHVTNDEKHDPRCGGCGCEVESPDYLTDLNAMHSAEEKLNQQQQTDYADNLFHLAPEDEIADVVEGVEVTYPSQFSLLHCTAAQRAEALLRTIGKWKDGTKSENDQNTLRVLDATGRDCPLKGQPDYVSEPNKFPVGRWGDGGRNAP